ncbi:MAG: hypothetical protein AABX54_05365 [Nanoarchaeota archaeon]
MKHPVEDRYAGIMQFGSDAEIFENYIDCGSRGNYNSNEAGELEEELVGGRAR